MTAKVLVIGSGGREHALAWKLAQSPSVNKIYVAPGNGGTADLAENVPIGFTDTEALLKFAKNKRIDLTVIGQEAASEAGVVDAFKAEGLLVFGPTKKASQIESSKVFSKDLMQQKSIPTAAYKTFKNTNDALKFVKSHKFPLVIKADGLAEGKGVIVCEDLKQANAAINKIMVDKAFGESGNSVVIEEFLSGAEVSIHALSDGKKTAVFPTSQDHKQIFNGDKGPNTGGMGVIAPVPWVKSSHIDFIEKNIVEPALKGLSESGSPFVGCLYPGLMIERDNVNVIEFNSRFGDPEAESYMRLLDADLFEVLSACARGELIPQNVNWKSDFVAVVALVSGGYPGPYQKGLPIKGITDAEGIEDVVVFHGGTVLDGEGYRTSGGRVVYVTATGANLDMALEKAYQAVNKISFKGMQYRTDIGRRKAPKV